MFNIFQAAKPKCVIVDVPRANIFKRICTQCNYPVHLVVIDSNTSLPQVRQRLLSVEPLRILMPYLSPTWSIIHHTSLPQPAQVRTP